jgi:hypothetical protein
MRGTIKLRHCLANREAIDPPYHISDIYYNNLDN